MAKKKEPKIKIQGKKRVINMDKDLEKLKKANSKKKK